MHIVKTIHNRENTRKVEVFQRDDGAFGFQEWKWINEENCWVPLPKQIISVIDTMQHALDEAEERIPWLKEGKGQ